MFLFLFLLSCNKPKKGENKIDIKTKINSKPIIKHEPIITNSLDSNFNWDLINIQKVTKGDTILFREWEVSKLKTILIYDNKTKYEISGDTIDKYYKTGVNRFSKYKFTVLSKTSKKTIEFYGIVDYGDFNDGFCTDVYEFNEGSPYAELAKISKKIGRLNFKSPKYKQYYIDFKVTDNAVHVIKLSNLEYSFSEIYKYELDTLIVLSNNNRIYPDSLRSMLRKEKNRINIKDPRK